ELAEALREIPYAKKMPVILLTSGGTDGIDPARWQVGFFSSIPKPWKSAALQRELLRVLGPEGTPAPIPSIEPQRVLEPDSAIDLPVKILVVEDNPTNRQVVL